MKMKILQIIFSLAPGGAERFVVDLSNELAKNDEVVVMTLKDDKTNPDLNQFYRPFLKNNITYKNLGIKQHGGFSIGALWLIYKAIKKEKADVIHLHTEGIVYFCLLPILFLNRKTTIVQTIHSDFKINYTSFIYKILFNTVGRLQRMRWAALSQTNFNEMMTAYPFLLGRRIDNGRSPMLPTDLNDSVLDEIQRFKKTNETKIYLHVGGCKQVKNQAMLVSAFNKFVSNGHDAILMIIGGFFDSNLGQNIKELAEDSIFFLGTRQNISDYMLNSDCFCLSSINEGLPITFLEAMLSGTPILSTPVKGAIDVIKNKITGVISKDFTEEEYIVALQYTYDHLIELQKNAQAEKDTCPFSIEVCASKYRDFYIAESTSKNKI